MFCLNDTKELKNVPLFFYIYKRRKLLLGGKMYDIYVST